MKKVLVVTPRFPIPDSGACEKDRLDGMKQFRRLGYEVRVIGKAFDFQDREKIETFGENHGISIELVPYRFTEKVSALKKISVLVRRLLWPGFWDGSAYEYTDPKINETLTRTLDEWKPDVVWFDYTYLWPLYRHVTRRNIPIVTRSINVEANHFLEEDGRTLLHYLQYIPKWLTERTTLRRSDLLYSITPRERNWYRRLGKDSRVVNLPLRGMPETLDTQQFILRDRTPLRAYFMGSTYNVAHNRRALEFLLAHVVPRVEERFPGRFEFHIFGGKVPKDFDRFLRESIHLRGHVEDIGKALQEMDIALIPSLYGAGMQQKIFESFSRGFPTVVTPRGIADYPFEDGVHYLGATNAEEFVDAMERLLVFEERQNLSSSARTRSEELFSGSRIDSIVEEGLTQILKIG
ncbi:MAG: glycosyltransferase family 4 protein [Planctomycetota bacterium]|jgi:hypothetical protein|nr:glycosyltransferase family 4 protein [Planctomycetota bacterium]